MRTFEIARVTWIDATHYRTENQIDWLKENATTTEFSTVGYLLKRDNEKVVIAHKINDDDNGRDTSVIPIVLIKKMETLVVESDRELLRQDNGGEKE